MATDARKHTAPGSAETPKRSSLNDLSLSVNDIVPVANATERDALYTTLTSAPINQVPATRPIYVDRLDTGTIERNAGTGWYRIGGEKKSLDTGYNETQKSAASGVVDLFGASDISFTLAAGGEVDFDFTLQYWANAAVAVVGTLGLLVDGALVADESLQIHSGVGALATNYHQATPRFSAWLAPGAHTANLRFTHGGGGQMNFNYQGFKVKG